MSEFEYKYFINVYRIDNSLKIKIGDKDNNMFEVFPLDKYPKYYDDDPSLNIELEITDNLQDLQPNIIRFEGTNGNPTPSGIPNPYHFEWRVFYRKYYCKSSFLISEVDIIPRQILRNGNAPANTLVVQEQYPLIKNKEGFFNLKR